MPETLANKTIAQLDIALLVAGVPPFFFFARPKMSIFWKPAIGSSSNTPVHAKKYKHRNLNGSATREGDQVPMVHQGGSGPASVSPG